MSQSRKSSHLAGPRIEPPAITGRESAADLIDRAFLAYNGARLREGARLLAERMLEPDVTIGLSITGALTPAGLGMSALIPLVRAGFVDWIVSTGANLYHDTHFGLGLPLHRGTFQADDVALREEGVVRIYDIFFDYHVLLDTDAFFREVIAGPEFQRAMGTAEFHHLCGKYVRAREEALGHTTTRSLLSAAYECGVPVYTSSPGDSSIGMNVAAKALEGNALQLDVPVYSPSPGDSTIGLNFSAIHTAFPERGPKVDPAIDVMEMSALVLDAKRAGGLSAVWILGGGAPKNFLLQTEPQLQEILGVAEKGHDFFVQVTDARPDTGGLSGATPNEAVSWGKIDPDRLPDTVVAYVDSTVALPLLGAYVLSRCKARKPRRLYGRLPELLERLRREYRKTPLYRRYWG